MNAEVTAREQVWIDVTASFLTRTENPSGVIRVERELASRALCNLGTRARFIIYDLDRGSFFAAKDVSNKPWMLDFEVPVSLSGCPLVVSFGLECNNKDYRDLVLKGFYQEIRLISVLYDLTGALNPQLTVPGYGEFLRGFFSDMVWGVTRFLAISHHTKSQLIEFCMEESLPVPSCSTFRLGDDPFVSKLESKPHNAIALALKGRQFVLLVSTIEPRKNHYCLYRAWTTAIEQQLIDPLKYALVFAGAVGWGSEDLIDQLAFNPSASSILVLSGLTDSEISWLYANCEFTVFPSFDEGYGLPVAESLRAGRSVLCSNRGALPEVGGNSVVYLDPFDIPKWRTAIVALINQTSEGGERIESSVDGFLSLSWDQSSQEFYSHVLNEIQ